MKNRLIIIVLASVFMSSCLKDEPFKEEFKGFEPTLQADGWEVSSPEAENINRNDLEQAYRLVYEKNRFVMANSLLVFRNEKLVAEAYPHHPQAITEYHNIQSCTKSITSVLAGIAVQQNIIVSLDEKLYNIFPELFDDDIAKREITISDALTMRSGLDFQNDFHTLRLYSTHHNSAQYVLSLGRNSLPGTVMHYSDGDPHLVSKVIETLSGKSLSEFAGEHLFGKLNIDNWQWESANDGTTFGAFSLYLTPRDFGKIGQLLLQDGKWEEEQIVDASFLQDAVTTQVLSEWGNQPYGYYFWIYPQWKGYAAMGHGGQFLFVAPEKNLVVVYTSWPYTGSSLWDNGEELMGIIYGSCR